MPYNSDTTQCWILHVIFHNVFKWWFDVRRFTAVYWMTITYQRSTSLFSVKLSLLSQTHTLSYKDTMSAQLLYISVK